MQTQLLDYCKQLIAVTKDEQELNRLHIIEQILSIPDCFLYLSIDTSINILMDLGYSKEDALSIYKGLSKFKN